MKKIILKASDKGYFSPKETLDAQMARYDDIGKDGVKKYLVKSWDKACTVQAEGDSTIIECEDKDEDYFCTYFDLKTDYAEIKSRIVGILRDKGYTELAKDVEDCPVLRILNQDPVETLISYILTARNKIVNTRRTIEMMCSELGEHKRFGDNEYCAFPKVDVMAGVPESQYRSMGAGFRAPRIIYAARRIDAAENWKEDLRQLETPDLKKKLSEFKGKGVGPKIADCTALYGFHKLDAFPVDIWIANVYWEDFGGSKPDNGRITKKIYREINAYFTSMFKDIAGVAQLYLFYCKRGKGGSSKEEKQ